MDAKLRETARQLRSQGLMFKAIRHRTGLSIDQVKRACKGIVAPVENRGRKRTRFAATFHREDYDTSEA